MPIPKTGIKAPDFTFTGSHGRQVTLSSLKGKKVILYFYPKDDTPGCTAEACNLRDNYSALKMQGFEVLGVSTDNSRSHEKFTGKYNLPFTLVPDPDKTIVNSYGVWGKKKFMGREYMGTLRTTFIIDENGIIEKVIDTVDTKNHTEQILKELSP
ncbi:MAG: thioredoxin-dependent thiol peroxidase [Bacteroidetes bacterium]|nr:thioredoxin-dependent thiol peroxidase [Bacteroidota bacterium]